MKTNPIQMANNSNLGNWLLKRGVKNEDEQMVLIPGKLAAERVIVEREDIPMVSVFKVGTKVGKETDTWTNRMEIQVERATGKVIDVELREGFYEGAPFSEFQVMNNLCTKALQWA